MPPNDSFRNNVKIAYRAHVRQRVAEIKAYIDEQRGNAPGDIVGLKVALKVFEEIKRIRRYPWASPRVEGMDENYRQQRVANRYMIYYYVADPNALIYLIELRHTSQKPLKPDTLKKYKREVEKQESEEKS